MVTTNMPEDGHFVMLWNYGGYQWCAALRWQEDGSGDKDLYQYMQENDSFERFTSWECVEMEAVYIV